MRYFYILFFCVTFLQAQNFELIGNRDIDFNWDVARVSQVYSDQEGNIFIYLTEASQPRTHELIRYNSNTNSWENITNNEFLVPGGARTSHGVGQPDGSILTVASSFDNQHYAYLLSPDGSFASIGGNPISGPNSRIFISTAVNPITNELYYVSSLLDTIEVRRFDGNQWIDLPIVANVDSQRTNIDFDELGRPYVAYKNGDSNKIIVAVFDGVNWSIIFTTPEDASRPSLWIESSNEIYLSASVAGANVKTYKYDGIDLSSVGEIIDGGANGTNDIIKTSSGDLFLATQVENGFYHFDTVSDNWIMIENDIADNLAVSGFRPQLVEIDGYVYNSFTDGTGITMVRFNDMVLNIDNNVKSKRFKLYPNPVDDILEIDFDLQSLTDTNININIYDLSGRKMMVNNLNTINKNVSMDISHLASSNYILVIRNDENNQVIQTSRIVKQ